MERITRDEFIADLNIQLATIEGKIESVSQYLETLIAKRNKMINVRLSLDRVEREGMRVDFTSEEDGINFSAQAKEPAGLIPRT